MTRGLQSCDHCGGLTRHADRRCASCRNDPARPPTLAELDAGIDLTDYLAGDGRTRMTLIQREPISYRGRGG